MKDEKIRKLRANCNFYNGVFAASYAFGFVFLFLGFFEFSFSFRFVSIISLGIGAWAVHERGKYFKQIMEKKK